MPPKKAKQRGTLASIETIVVTYEDILKAKFEQLLRNDNAGFLIIHQRAALLSDEYYNKMRDYVAERKVAALLEKTRSASLQKLLSLLTCIQEKLGEDSTLSILRHQLQYRPFVPEPTFMRPKTRWDSAVTNLREKEVVLMDRFKIMKQDAAEKINEEKRKAEEACAQQEDIQNETDALKEKLKTVDYLYSEIEKLKGENKDLAAQVTLWSTKAEEQTTRAHELENELNETKHDFLEKLDEKEKLLEDRQLSTELEPSTQLEATQRELEQTRQKLSTALKELTDKQEEMEVSVKDQFRDMTQFMLELKQDVQALQQENHEMKQEIKTAGVKQEKNRPAVPGVKYADMEVVGVKAQSTHNK